MVKGYTRLHSHVIDLLVTLLAIVGQNRFPIDHVPSEQRSGFRIIWRTRASTSVKLVQASIVSVVPSLQVDSASLLLSVTKSFRRSPSSEQKAKWWFTLSAPDDTLEAIDACWKEIPSQLGWKLQKALRPATLDHQDSQPAAGDSANDQETQRDTANTQE